MKNALPLLYVFILIVTLSVPVVHVSAAIGDACALPYEPCEVGVCDGGVCQPDPDGGAGGGAGDGGTGAGDVTLINPLQGSGDLEGFLTQILRLVVRVGTIAVILMLIFTGFKFVAARGEPGEISEARQMLLWTLVGGLILLGAVAISEGIAATVRAVSTGS